MLIDDVIIYYQPFSKQQRSVCYRHSNP